MAGDLGLLIGGIVIVIIIFILFGLCYCAFTGCNQFGAVPMQAPCGICYKQPCQCNVKKVVKSTSDDKVAAAVTLSTSNISTSGTSYDIAAVAITVNPQTTVLPGTALTFTDYTYSCDSRELVIGTSSSSGTTSILNAIRHGSKCSKCSGTCNCKPAKQVLVSASIQLIVPATISSAATGVISQYPDPIVGQIVFIPDSTSVAVPIVALQRTGVSQIPVSTTPTFDTANVLVTLSVTPFLYNLKQSGIFQVILGSSNVDGTTVIPGTSAFSVNMICCQPKYCKPVRRCRRCSQVETKCVCYVDEEC